MWSEPPQTPAMAMGGLVGKRLDQLLNEMVKAGIELPVKMVITPHNESWPFGRLIEEVGREHALFMEMERLKKLSDRAHRRLEQQEEQALREAARQAKDLLARMRLQDDRQPTHEQLSGAADRLQPAAGQDVKKRERKSRLVGICAPFCLCYFAACWVSRQAWMASSWVSAEIKKRLLWQKRKVGDAG